MNTKKHIPIHLPAPVVLIQTSDHDNIQNFAPVSWVGVANSDPLCFSISLRESTKTFKNIIDSKCFSIILPPVGSLETVDLLGTTSGNKIDKSELLKSNDSFEFKDCTQYDCKVIQQTQLGSHHHFIGEVVNYKINQSEKIEDYIILSPSKNEYHFIGNIQRKAFSQKK